MAKKQLVLAFFENEDAADTAVDTMKKWDKASKEIKLGSIGVLVKDDKGKVKTHKLGARHTATGVAAGVLATVLSGGVALLGGIIVGGVTGSLIHKGLGLSKEDEARIESNLNDGAAAVCILAKNDEADAVSDKLIELGGTAEIHEVEAEAVEEAATGVAPEEAPAEEAPESTEN